MELVRRLLAFSPFALLLLAAAQPGPLLAQYQKYEGMTITNIQFDPPDQPLEAAELHDILPVKMGQPAHITDVRSAIERLFATGRYADIRGGRAALSGRSGPHLCHEEQLVRGVDLDFRQSLQSAEPRADRECQQSRFGRSVFRRQAEGGNRRAAAPARKQRPLSQRASSRSSIGRARPSTSR